MNPYLLIKLDVIDSFPEPEDKESFLNLVSKLTYRMQIICALTTIESVLDVWDKNIVLENRWMIPTEVVKHYPRKLIDQIKIYLNNGSSPDKIQPVPHLVLRKNNDIAVASHETILAIKIYETKTYFDWKSPFNKAISRAINLALFTKLINRKSYNKAFIIKLWNNCKLAIKNDPESKIYESL